LGKAELYFFVRAHHPFPSFNFLTSRDFEKAMSSSIFVYSLNDGRKAPKLKSIKFSLMSPKMIQDLSVVEVSLTIPDIFPAFFLAFSPVTGANDIPEPNHPVT